MSDDTTKSERLPTLMGAGFDETSSDSRIIQGTIIRCVDGHWSDRDGVALPPDVQLIALATTNALQRWQDQKPIETIVQQAGEPLADLKQLNAQVFEEEWEKGIDGKRRPPWVLQHIVYLLDPNDASLFTFLNSTKGAEIAIERLGTKVKWMRALRGQRVVPLVKLDAKPMTTKFGQKMRPEFTILGWRELGPRHGETSQLAGKQPKAIDQIGQPVKPVSTGEALDDEIQF